MHIVELKSKDVLINTIKNTINSHMKVGVQMQAKSTLGRKSECMV